MMKDALRLRQKKSIQLNAEETELLSIYNEEYNDIFHNIFSFSKEEFTSYLNKCVLFFITTRRLDYPKDSIDIVLKYFIESTYKEDYLKVKVLFQEAKQDYESLNPNSISTDSFTYFKSNYIKHCSDTKFPLHTCGNRLLLSPSYNQEPFVLCLLCKMIYKSSLIKLQCDICSHEFFTKILSPKEAKEQFHEATWVKYHCNAVINDKMKCLKCKEVLYYDNNNNIIKCFNCNFISDPEEIEWICMICKSGFTSLAKDYNLLEYKPMKLCVKEAFVKKVYAIPNESLCNCKFEKDEKNYLMYNHKDSCNGKMLKGQLNKKDILVCGKCHQIAYEKSFLWKCPNCHKSFRSYRTDSNPESNPCNSILRQNSHVQNLLKEEPLGPQNQAHSMKKIGFYSPKKNSQFAKSDSKSTLQSTTNDLELIPKDTYLRGGEYSPAHRHPNKSTPFINLQRDLNTNNSDTNTNNSHHQSNPPIQLKFCQQTDNSSPVNTNTSKSAPKEISAHDSISTYHTEKNNTINSIKSNKLNEFNADDYSVVGQIGQGTFGQIYKIECPQTKQQFAMKKVTACSSQDIAKKIHEYDLLINLTKTEDLAIVAVIATQTKKLDITTYVMYVQMELAIMDWDQEIISRGQSKEYYTQDELLHYLTVLCKTLAELQIRNICHRDIKPANILMFENNVLKLSDFDEAKTKPDGNKKTIRGTELFMSPMLLNAYRTSNLSAIEHDIYKSDLFSLGLCFIYAAACSYQPLYEIRELTDLTSISFVVSKYLRKKYDQDFIDLLCVMVEVNEKSRKDFLEFEDYLNNYKAVIQQKKKKKR